VNYNASIPGNPIPFFLISALETLKQGLVFAVCKNEHEQCEGNIITFALFHARVKFYACMFCLGHWLGPVTMHGWLGPAQPHGPGWAQPENKKFSSNKILFKNL
jgi:hypothetical protein